MSIFAVQISDIIFVATGASLGAVIRYLVISQRWFIGTLPIGVLTVNVIGSIILGAFMVIVQLYGLDNRYILFTAIGFSGSLTTMSAFAFESVNMLEAKQYYLMAVNIASNIGLSIIGIFIGRVVATIILNKSW